MFDLGFPQEESEEGAGGKLGGMFRVYVHASPTTRSSPSGETSAPLLVFQVPLPSKADYKSSMTTY